MASEAEKRELQQKVQALVEAKFQGDYQKAFDHYAQARTKDGKINKAELTKLLGDADIGNFFTRGVWADEIIAELDADKDGAISWAEFEEKLKEAPVEGPEPEN